MVPWRDLCNLGQESEPLTPLLAFCSEFVTSLPHKPALLQSWVLPPALAASLQTLLTGSPHPEAWAGWVTGLPGEALVLVGSPGTRGAREGSG